MDPQFLFFASMRFLMKMAIAAGASGCLIGGLWLCGSGRGSDPEGSECEAAIGGVKFKAIMRTAGALMVIASVALFGLTYLSLPKAKVSTTEGSNPGPRWSIEQGPVHSAPEPPAP